MLTSFPVNLLFHTSIHPLIKIHLHSSLEGLTLSFIEWSRILFVLKVKCLSKVESTRFTNCFENKNNIHGNFTLQKGFQVGSFKSIQMRDIKGSWKKLCGPSLNIVYYMIVATMMRFLSLGGTIGYESNAIADMSFVVNKQ